MMIGAPGIRVICSYEAKGRAGSNRGSRYRILFWLWWNLVANQVEEYV